MRIGTFGSRDIIYRYRWRIIIRTAGSGAIIEDRAFTLIIGDSRIRRDWRDR